MTIEVAKDGTAKWNFYRKSYQKARWRKVGMLVKSARIEMTWEDGRTVTLGTVGIDENGKPAARCRHMRQRIGWELVRIGFREMFPKMKWSMKQNDQG